MSTENSNPVATEWNVDAGRKCLGCGSHVTPQLINGYGTNDGELEHCTNCEGICWRDMRQGAGQMPDYDPAIHRRQHTASDNNPIFLGEIDE